MTVHRSNQPHDPGSRGRMMLAERILEDRTTSFWLTEALRSALRRDPVDAVRDAELLFKALDERFDQILVRQEGIVDGRQ